VRFLPRHFATRTVGSRRSPRVGNPVFYVGAETGRDGLAGAFVCFAGVDGGITRRSAGGAGRADPFKEKLLFGSMFGMLATMLSAGIQDMGAAGLTAPPAKRRAAVERRGNLTRESSKARAGNDAHTKFC